MNKHPITPPSELVDQWDSECESDIDAAMHLATQAARWGADQELEACKQVIMEQQWFAAPGFRLDQLHNARRPKPPSLKEQALSELDSLENMGVCNANTIRRALEALPDE